MTARIKTGDTVKIISGDDKGKTGKVLKVLAQQDAALVDSIGARERHVKPSRLNPKGGKKHIHVPVALSKLALVIDEKTGKTSRIGYAKNSEGKTIRLARKLNNREVK
ncbi:MAG: 50S ribosomal protein L24 [Candidatus Nomurabacteria bacterium]|jgi:large subunit ribosomal protein L24|nr:50S ribosomal protein L24 [Candidatus Nomurabacteria bacterium]